METIRESIRELKSSERQSERESILNKNRCITIETVNEITKEDVIKKAKNLKIKSSVTCDLLKSLRDAFFQSKENIFTFLAVDGALDALVRALSGQNAGFQIQSAYCFCNLSLGDEKRSLQIIKTAGPYLILHLKGMNSPLIEASAWALGNLSSHGTQCAKLLMNQGIFPALSNLLSHDDENVRISAAYSLSHFLYHGFDLLKPEEFQQLVNLLLPIFKSNNSSAAFLMFVCSSVKECQFLLLQNNIHVTSVSFLLDSLQKDEKHSVFYLRILCNLITEETGQAAYEIFHHEVTANINTLHSALMLIFNSRKKHLVSESFWLFGNFLNHSNLNVRKMFEESKMLKDVEGTVKNLQILNF